MRCHLFVPGLRCHPLALDFLDFLVDLVHQLLQYLPLILVDLVHQLLQYLPLILVDLVHQFHQCHLYLPLQQLRRLARATAPPERPNTQERRLIRKLKEG